MPGEPTIEERGGTDLTGEEGLEVESITNDY